MSANKGPLWGTGRAERCVRAAQGVSTAVQTHRQTGEESCHHACPDNGGGWRGKSVKPSSERRGNATARRWGPSELLCMAQNKAAAVPVSW